MVANRYVILEGRAVVRVSGSDARSFLQGIVSQDIEKVRAHRAAYSAFLTPQGKYLHDFCIAEFDDDLLLDCEAGRADDLVARMSRYRLRADVTLAVEGDLVVAAIYGGASPAGLGATPGDATRIGDGVLFIDPRRAELGCRAILPREDADQTLAQAGFVPGDFADYDALRIAFTIPDGTRDLDVEKTVLLEANFDELHGIDWEKGCYLGQELTARTKYRGLIKRRLVTVRVDGPPPTAGTPIKQQGTEVGTVHSALGDRAIATLRIEVIDAAPTGLLAGDSIISVG